MLRAFAVAAALTLPASAGLPDFAPPSPAEALASAHAAPAVRVAAQDYEGGRTLQHSRSEPSHRFDLDAMAGT